MPLTKSQLQTLVNESCSQQGAVAVPGPVLKELVDNYIESVASAAAGAVITEQPLIAEIADGAAGASIATAVNSILDALKANGIVAVE